MVLFITFFAVESVGSSLNASVWQFESSKTQYISFIYDERTTVL